MVQEKVEALNVIFLALQRGADNLKIICIVMCYSGLDLVWERSDLLPLPFPKRSLIVLSFSYSLLGVGGRGQVWEFCLSFSAILSLLSTEGQL